MDFISRVDWAQFTLSVLSILLVVSGSMFLYSLKEKVFGFYDRERTKPMIADNKHYLKPLFILGVLMVVVGILLAFLLVVPDLKLLVTVAIIVAVVVGSVVAWW